MVLFPYAHATHPQWQMAAALVLAQLRAFMSTAGYAGMPGLGVLYLTDRFAPHAQDILDEFQAELPLVTDWVGSVGVGIVSNNVEYWDEPALAVMLLDIPLDQFRVFSGVSPLGRSFGAATALVHADAHTHDVVGLVHDFAAHMESGRLFGGIASSRTKSLQIASSSRGKVRGQGAAGDVFSGGMSGVAFGPGVSIATKISQGCQPLSKVHTVTQSDHNVVIALDGEPALDVMLRDLKLTFALLDQSLDMVRSTLVGLVQPQDRPLHDRARKSTGDIGEDATVRHIIGLDPARKGIAVAATVAEGSQLVFCQRNAQAARADLVRMCTELREEIEPHEGSTSTAHAQLHLAAQEETDTMSGAAPRISGAIYFSCTGRGGGGLGPVGTEMQWIRKALGDIPIVGLFAGGEIGHHHVYGYSGVLTVFMDCAAQDSLGG
jgi:small ligand-binding sensory domain FIST